MSISKSYKIENNHVVHETVFMKENKNSLQRNGVSKSNETTIETKIEEEVVQPVGLFEIFKYAKCFDVIIIIVAILASITNGAALPCLIIVFGDMIDKFSMNQYSNSTSNSTGTSFIDDMKLFALYYIAIACAVLVLSYLQVTCWVTSAARQSHRMRVLCFRSIMRQEMGWFDLQKSGDLNSRLTDGIGKINEGIGDKLGQFFQWFTAFLVGITIGFVYGWKLSLVCLSGAPLLAVAGFLFSKLTASFTEKEMQKYANAGAVAEEVLGGIRTVMAFGGEKHEVSRYSKLLVGAKEFGIRKGFTSGVTLGVTWLLIFCAYALGFWYSSKLIREMEPGYSTGRALVVFFCILIGAMGLGQAMPPLQNFTTSRGAASAVFKLIERISAIDPLDQEHGLRPQSVTGEIEFRNVSFRYPARPDVNVLSGLSVKAQRAQTVALVGSSGCGKSTLVQLIQRFYDPEQGTVFLDGTDVRQLSISWLRSQIGVVSQEPVLFATTIADNVRFGREDVTQEEIVSACRQANAADFIETLPDKYNTLVGDRGAQLSGGQKQRLAIARALVRNPRVLLLDEATSALDSESEKVVQDALDKAREGRTTLVVAHRLSTIRNADVIVGIQGGRVVEQGSHDELMASQGLYYSLSCAQNQREAQANEVESADNEEKVNEVSPKKMRIASVSETQANEDVEAGKTSKKAATKAGFMRLMTLNKPEWIFIFFGSISALLNGGVQPAFSIIFANVIAEMGNPNREEQERNINLYVILFVVIGVVSFASQFLQAYMFAKSGETLTERCRRLMFEAYLRQDMSWFDQPDNNLGALTTRLSTHASQIQGATGIRLGMGVSTLANLGAGIGISFYYSWKLTLAILAFMPLIVVGGALQIKVMQGYANSDKKALEEAGKVAVEGIENIRTVASLGREARMIAFFKSQLEGPHRNALKMVHLQGAAFGLSQSVIFFAYAAAFYLGAYLITQGELDFVRVFRIFGAIVFGAMGAGNAAALAPDYGKARDAAEGLFELLDRQPPINSASPEGEQPDKCSGHVTFEDVHFRYSTRPDVAVLRGLSLTVEPGQRVALVGSSGCGKSTTVALLQRLYEEGGGQVLLDGNPLSRLNIGWLRRQMGVVSQEPVLFARSVAENISYGDLRRDVPMSEVIEAAQQANIHDFVCTLPDGYNTLVGEKGSQLSGGQKQRVAIARALVRNPRVLLLDEATSALDTESEKVVQEALEKAQLGRTCLVIAHRLSTVRNADLILVIQNGRVRECGTHNQLMELQGIYTKLVKTQLTSNES